ncbi:Esterase FE4 [Zootermopsis nevadensis]|uniref:Carboxylic ester hydrolase n=3 Tax=Zootermopsis nevadensis TaxID=136037 RepID=A0A067QSW2_ZOONE|nr:Esterase FE4 [Zootermopsis nevadensis]
MWKNKFREGSGCALLFLVICVGFIVIVYLNSAEEDPELQVFVKQGALRGQHFTTRKGRHILGFQRIPYALPPIGDLRFRSPQPFGNWKGVLDATRPAPKCVQRNVYLEEQEVSGQEDCLFINVYTPHIKGHHLLDVMVYIHGGGWVAGTGRNYQPTYLLDRDVVLVTFNYRLGPLGFLSTGDSACPGNNGMKDQVAALRWVRDNIAAFGGNPSSVTIFGESAGGASVHYHMLSPASRGLFHRAVSQSGTAFCPWSLAPNGSSKHQAEELAFLLDCPTQPSSEMVSCLRTKDAVDITATDRAYMEWNIHPMIPFRPVIENGDDAFIPASPLELSRNYTAVPWMTGITSEEGTIAASRLYGKNLIPDMDARFKYAAPIALYYSETSPRKDEVTKLIRDFYFGNSTINNDTVASVVNMFTDGWFLQGADRAVSLHFETGTAPVFYYYFTYRGSKSHSAVFGDANRNYGVCHADDLIYIFPSGDTLLGTTLTETDDKMVDIMTTLWTNFARTGNPTPTPFNGVQWLQVASPYSKEYVQIDKDGLSPKRGLLEERVNFWNTLPLEIPPSSSGKDEL